jgi:hypothetical protein
MDEPLRGANPWPATDHVVPVAQRLAGMPPAPADPSGWRLDPQLRRRLTNLALVAVLLGGGFLAAKKVHAWLNPPEPAAAEEFAAQPRVTGTVDDVDPAPARIGPQTAGEERIAALLAPAPAGYRLAHDRGEATYPLGPEEVRPRTGYLRRWRSPSGTALALYAMTFRSPEAAVDFSRGIPPDLPSGIKGAKGMRLRTDVGGHWSVIELRRGTTSILVVLESRARPTATQLRHLRALAKTQHRRLLAAPALRPVPTPAGD